MSDIKFSRNFSDLSVAQGTNAGFQFEFHCERCSDTWRSPFEPYRSGQASGWIGRAAGFFGGVLGGVGSAVEGLAESGFGEARDEALTRAVANAGKHFHRCAGCHSTVCSKCFNVERGLCLNCAPNTQVAIESARAQGEVDAARERAVAEGARRAEKLDVKTDHQLVCPRCQTESRGARFCPECGEALGKPAACKACKADIPAGSRFCPECGKKV